MPPLSLMETLSPGNTHSLSLPRAAGLKGPSGPGGSGVWSWALGGLSWAGSLAALVAGGEGSWFPATLVPGLPAPWMVPGTKKENK